MNVSYCNCSKYECTVIHSHPKWDSLVCYPTWPRLGLP